MKLLGYTAYTHSVEGFDEWIKLLDECIEDISGCSLDDLADAPTYDMWEDGYTPAAASAEILADNGWDF